MDLHKLPIRITNHAHKRISKRFGIHGKVATRRFGEDVLRNGTIISCKDEAITIIRRGCSFIFKMAIDGTTKESVMLMLTACNDNKNSEWKRFQQGKEIKARTVKLSKVQIMLG
jgi:hypothetical protein